MKQLVKTFPLLFLLLLTTQCRKQPAKATGLVTEKAMVVSARKEASIVGSAILERGGNAFDAMVGTELALAVLLLPILSLEILGVADLWYTEKAMVMLVLSIIVKKHLCLPIRICIWIP